MEGSSNGLKKGTWTFEEDSLLRKCIDKYGEGKWHQVPLRAGLNRCRKSCRLRWLNYLKPTIKKGKLSSDEVDLVLRMHKLLGNRWSLIAGRLPNRTANDIKNYWNTHLSKECEPSFKAKVKKRNIVIAKKIDVLKPRARSFFVNNGCSHLKGIPQADFITQCTVLNNNINVCENNNKEKENNEIVNSLMDGENMWWESFLEESQDAYPVNPEATKTEEGATSAIHVEQFWSFLDGETEELI